MTGIMQMFVAGGAAAAPIVYWSEGVNIGGLSASIPYSKMVVASGNLYWGHHNYNTSPSPAWLTGLNVDTGAISYAKQYSTPSGTYAAVTPTTFDSSGNGTIVRTLISSGSGPLYYRVDSSGTLLWAKQLSGALLDQQAPNQLTPDNAGNVYHVNSYLSGGNYIPVIVKLDSTGAVSWARQWRDTANVVTEYSREAAIDSSGDVLWMLTSTSGIARGHIVKYSSSGTFVSATYLTNSNTARALALFSIVTAPSGSTYVGGVGLFTTSLGAVSRPFVLKLNSSFAVQWVKCLTDIGTDSSMNISLDASENLYISARPRNPGTDAAFSAHGVMSLDSSGSVRWFRSLLAGPVNGGYASLSDTSVTTDGTVVYVLGTVYYAALGYVSTVVKLPTSGGPTGYYPGLTASSSTPAAQIQGMFVGAGSTNNGTSIEDITAQVVSTSVTGASTNLSLSTTTPSSPSVSNLTNSVAKTVYSITSTSQSMIFNGCDVTYSWIAPSGVTSVSVVAIGGGSGGGYMYAGSGGGLGYGNNATVTPGTTYYVRAGRGGLASACNGATTNGGDSWFAANSTGTSGVVAVGFGASPGLGGSYSGSGGGSGGNRNNSNYGGAGGAGGYIGNGGAGGSYPSGTGAFGSGGGGGGGGGAQGAYICSCVNSIQPGSGNGGGVGVLGSSCSGAGGSASSQGFPGSYGSYSDFGGGGGAGGYQIYCFTCPCASFFNPITGSPGQRGAVRVIWPGSSRNFPSNNTGSL